MKPSPNRLPAATKWEAEHALAVAEAEAYERERAIAKIRLLMRRYELTPEDIGAMPGPMDLQHSSDRLAPVDQR